MQRGRLFKRLGRPHGFSIAEVMVAAGMLGIVSLGLMRMTEQSTKQQKKMRVDFNMNSLLYELNVVNKSSDACENTLTGLNLTGLPGTPVDLPAIRNANNGIILNGDGTAVYGTGTGGAVEVDDIRIISSDPVMNAAAGVPVNYTLRIELDFTRRGVPAAQEDMKKYITMSFVDNDGNGLINFAIDSCVSEAVEKSAVCDALGGVMVLDTGVERCANIDLFNDPTDATGAGIGQHYGVTARGGLMVTNDGAAWNSAPVNHWSMVPSAASPSVLTFGIDDDQDPTDGDGTPYTVLQLEGNADGSSRAVTTRADTHTFAATDGGSRLVLDDTNNDSYFPQGNVGIGTTDPEASLLVYGNTNPVYGNTANVIAAFNTGLTDRGGLVIGSLNSNAPFIGTQTGTDTKGLTFRTNNENRMKIAQTTGNVGIGTTNPLFTLDVQRDSYGDVAQFMTLDGTRNPRLNISGSADGTIIEHTYSTAAQNLMFQVGGVEAMRIDGSTNIAIGSTTMAGKLHVTGGDAYLTRTVSEIGATVADDCTAPGDDDCKLVNKAWVFNTLSGLLAASLTEGQKEDIIEHILNTDADQQWPEMKLDVLNDIEVSYDSAGSQTYTSSTCATGFVNRIMYNATTGTFYFACDNTSVGGCSTKESCANVYAGQGAIGKLCSRTIAGAWKCISAPSVAHATSCQNVTPTWDGIVSYTWYATCPGNKFVKSVHISPNWFYIYNYSTSNVGGPGYYWIYTHATYTLKCCRLDIMGAE